MRGRALAALALGLLAAGPAMAQQAADPHPMPSITVIGHATASVVPDVAVVTIGVASERSRAAEAAADNNRTAQALMDVVKAAGIEPRDVTTTAVDLDAVYDSPAKGTPKLTGYHASLTLQIRVKPIDKAGALVGALTDAGANSIDGIEFVASADAARDDRLKADAARDARRLAQIYVEALGVRLGRVLSIAPGEVEAPAPRSYLKQRFVTRAAIVPAPPVPLAAGAQEQIAEVTVTFEIAQ